MNESKFTGSMLEYWAKRILMYLIIGGSLGLATPWAVCMFERWKAEHTYIDGVQLSFDGTGFQLLGNWLLWYLLFWITLGIYGFWVPVKMRRWVMKHTHGVNSSRVSDFGGSAWAYWWRNQVLSWGSFLTLGFAMPRLLTWYERWLARYTFIDSCRLRFDGTALQLWGNWIKRIVLCIVTFGIYYLWVAVEVEKWRVKHTHFGIN